MNKFGNWALFTTTAALKSTVLVPNVVLDDQPQIKTSRYPLLPRYAEEESE